MASCLSRLPSQLSKLSPSFKRSASKSEGSRIRQSFEGKIAALLIAALVLAAGMAVAFHAWTGSAWLGALFSLTVAVPACLYLLHRLMLPANRLIRALTDGVLSLRDNDFSISIARDRNDELGLLVDVYNGLGAVLRSERHDILQRELLLDTVIQTTPLALVLTDEKGTVLMANAAARTLFGGGKRLEGRPFGALRRATNPAFEQAVQRGDDGLFTVESDDDSDTWHLSTRHFSLNRQPRRLYLFKRMTRELARQEVATWKKVIRVIAHELNNSLAPISSLASSGRLVAGRRDIDKLETIFATIEERASHLKTFIEGYARFAKLPQPRIEPVEWQPFVTSLRQTAPFEPDGPLPERPGAFDPAQIEQVLINLIKNAHESGSDPADIRLSIHERADSVGIRVVDRGCGMSDAVLASAMLPFYSTKRTGTGLGLTLAREIVEAHGGRMSLHNRSAGGIAVEIWLPARAGDGQHTGDARGVTMAASD